MLVFIYLKKKQNLHGTLFCTRDESFVVHKCCKLSVNSEGICAKQPRHSARFFLLREKPHVAGLFCSVVDSTLYRIVKTTPDYYGNEREFRTLSDIKATGETNDARWTGSNETLSRRRYKYLDTTSFTRKCAGFPRFRSIAARTPAII